MEKGKRMLELKPCPFCGGNVDYISIYPTLGAIECTKCRIQVLLPFCETEELYEVWNRRVKE